ncbi:M23 family metallopeptidase [Isoptericola sp. F-RaC21]|uniref:murein hydrolase activator EnvC family protein n=1 Tax=Isoptericola sp. F-RaC21 TaxID=3141452 RepID=UPI00315BC6EB
MTPRTTPARISPGGSPSPDRDHGVMVRATSAAVRHARSLVVSVVAVTVAVTGAGSLAGATPVSADAGVAPAVSKPADGGWERPVPGEVAHPFDPPAEAWGAGHRGVDLAAAAGAQVRSPAAGVVSFAGQVADKPVVVVTHPDGLRSTFEPVTASVRRGDAVAAGDVVGTLAAVPGHCAPTGCLHWGVLRGEVYLDPLALLGDAPPIVLLPGGP